MKQAIYIFFFILLSAISYGQTKVTIRGSSGSSGGGGTVDQTLQDGSANAIANNAVYDGLQIKLGETTSDIFPTRTAYMVNGHISGNKPIEILNLGKISADNASYPFLVPTGILKASWSMEHTWNLKYDSVNKKWLSANNTFPQHMAEVGWEGITLHAVPNGSTNFSDTWHEIFQVRSHGVDGTAGLTSGVFNQSKAPMYWKYKSGTYTDDNHPWQGGSTRGDDPFIWLHAEEGKGNNGEFLRFESNGPATGGGLYFRKSRGTYGGKTAVTQNDNAGFIMFSLWDGTAFQNTARIWTIAEATAGSDFAPQSIAFQTSATNSAGLTTRMKITGAGYITYELQNTPSSSSDATQPIKGFWFDDNYIYYKTSTGTIKRVALTTF